MLASTGTCLVSFILRSSTAIWAWLRLADLLILISTAVKRMNFASSSLKISATELSHLMEIPRWRKCWCRVELHMANETRSNNLASTTFTTLTMAGSAMRHDCDPPTQLDAEWFAPSAGRFIECRSLTRVVDVMQRCSAVQLDASFENRFNVSPAMMPGNGGWWRRHAGIIDRRRLRTLYGKRGFSDIRRLRRWWHGIIDAIEDNYSLKEENAKNHPTLLVTNKANKVIIL